MNDPPNRIVPRARDADSEASMAMSPADTLANLALQYMDAYRRWMGAVADVLGLGPQPSAFEVVETGTPATLRRYSDCSDSGPAVLLVPAPIKSADIWDYAPEISVVCRYLDRGFRVYLLQWPRIAASDGALGLEDYAQTMLSACLDTVQRETEAARVHLVGHSIGGTLAALHCARHPERAQSLLLLGSPLNFTPDSDALSLLVCRSRMADTAWAAAGTVPGSMLNIISAAAAPEAFVLERSGDMAASLLEPDRLRLHARVERWALEERALPGRLFLDLVERLYRDNGFVTGGLTLAGQRISPRDIEVPVAAVVYDQCRIAPPRAVVPAMELLSSRRRDLFRYGPETGVSLQHVAMMIGPRAHARLWPGLLDWSLNRKGQASARTSVKGH